MQSRSKIIKSNKDAKKGPYSHDSKSLFGQPLNNGSSTVSFPLERPGPPDRLGSRLRFTDDYVDSVTIGSLYNQIFRMNSLYDPDFTGVFSNSPSFFTFLTTAYKLYCVLGAMIEVEFSNLGSVGADVGVWISDQNLSGSTYSQLASSRRVKTRLLGPNSGMNRATIKLSCSTSEIVGQQEVESDSNLYASIGANPADLWYAGIFIQSSDLSTTANVRMRVTIDFHAIFKELTGYVA